MPTTLKFRISLIIMRDTSKFIVQIKILVILLESNINLALHTSIKTLNFQLFEIITTESNVK